MATDKIFKGLAQQVANLQFTIKSLEEALRRSHAELDAVIDVIEHELAYDSFEIYPGGTTFGHEAAAVVDALSRRMQAPLPAPDPDPQTDPSGT